MRGRIVIVNEAVFRALWEANWSAASIGRLIEVSQGTAKRYAEKFDLAARDPEAIKAMNANIRWSDQPLEKLAEDVLGYPVPDPVYKNGERYTKPSKPTPDEIKKDRKPKHTVTDADGRWTPHRDKLILETGGRYSEIADLSERWGLGTTTIMARYHILRPRMVR